MLFKRNSTYYFRLRIPSDVRKHFPFAEITRSLHTQLYRQAKSLARGKLGELEKVFMKIRSGILSDDEIIKLVDKYKRENLAHDTVVMDEIVESYHTLPSEEDLQWMDEDEYTDDGTSSVKGFRALLARLQHRLRQDASDNLLDMRGMDASTMQIASRLVHGQQVDKDSQEFKNLCRAVALANKEMYETMIQRTETGDSDYDRHERTKPKSKTLKDLITIYHKEKEQSWADPASTKAIHSRILHMFGDIPLSEIDREMCVQFREDLKEYPLKNSDFTTPWRTLSARKKTRLSERTQNGTVSELLTLFDYANDNHMGIMGNPARNLLKRKEDCEPKKVREYYTVEELNQMVQVLAKVDKIKKPETFWIPLMALYTGARANEICMLRCDDFVQEEKTWFIQFRNVPEYNQRTKNENDRKTPVHPVLVKLGLIVYCKKQRQAGSDRLFSNLKLKRGKWNVDYGKQYNRTFKRKFLQGYTEEQLSAKDLHTFRVTLISWFIKSGKVNDMLTFETLRSIVGHFEDSETNAIMKYLQNVKITLKTYGGGFEVDPVSFLNQLDYGIDLSTLLKAS